MIKKIWDAIHFGRFSSQWRNDPPADPTVDDVVLGKTWFYETHLKRSDAGWTLVTENGGFIGRMAFYAMLPVYLAFAVGIAMGHVEFMHFILFEVFFILAFGTLNGIAIHKLAQDPTFGVEELSLHRIAKS